MEFRLLIEATDPLSQATFPLESKQWALSAPLDIDDDSTFPPFACISYLWGSEREPHALVSGETMSNHALPSLAAAVRTASCKAFWTDVFCIPRTDPARQSTLENMGYIYSRASEVIIVLGEETCTVIEELQSQDFFSEAALQTLERDEWVSSVWTYQEIVNGGNIYFVSERRGDKSTSIEGEKLFGALGYGLVKWEKSTCSNTEGTKKVFPRLSALEQIFADWQVGGAYILRPALNVFSSLAYKRNADAANYFYAILGTLTPSPEQLVWNSEQNLADKMMAICESKNDFSFIYSVADRDPNPARCWRPIAAPLTPGDSSLPSILRPILIWHCWGEAQNGRYDAEGLWLDGMTNMPLASSIGDIGREKISDLLFKRNSQHKSDAELCDAALAFVRSWGFEGDPTPMFTTGGLIFTQEAVQTSNVVRLLVSTQIHWPQGAPGLVHASSAGEKRYVPCAYIGSYKLLVNGQSVLL